jgi:cell division protein FtsQ
MPVAGVKMRIHKNISKIFVLAFWLLISAGVLVLLVAAVNIKNRQTCKAVEIEITGVEEFLFLDKAEVRNIITEHELGKPEGKPVASFNLQRLERTLEKNVWVRDAELFFDNNMVLHVNISEREPVARIFTASGKTYYIDSSVHPMPLSDKMNIKIPVFTNFPSDKLKLKGKDLELMRQVKDLAMYISDQPFFKAQITQVDITPSRGFEMVPLVGNHVIEFGNAENASSKFKRLFLFYHQVLSQTGFDKYTRVNVQYARQVLGTRRAFAGKIDSVQVIKNIEKLIEESKEKMTDSVFTFVDKNLASLKKADSTLTVDIPPANQQIDSMKRKVQVSSPAKSNPVTPKKKSAYASRNPEKKQETNPSNVYDKPKPKAVMPKLN